MSIFKPPLSTVALAQNLLTEFNCLETQPTLSLEKAIQVRQGLLILVQASDYQMLGICADSLGEATTTLSQYLTAFNFSVPLDYRPIPPIEGAVYLKFNGLSQSFYASSYLESYRGVLVSYQSSPETPEAVNGIYGHFPLDLFAPDSFRER
ncbi:MAG: DUF1824 family protein [Oscillatoriales cyanobacterium RM1_1_9]|nr:DUF1824 family protein [Oscillatoriales cyanobacterium SM2_3_0]NJO46382.1 DUF1824 family protein [Oscillatoriales cyanobacterium RM2_1_1]NJO71198.1 DUF1824 family protein [Oscillatoriales cyanobacterium RM1_1_9]